MSKAALWHTGTKAHTLMFLREAKRPLKGISDDMSEVENGNDITDWDVGVLECRICSQRQTSVIPHVNVPIETFECFNCGNMTAEIIEVDNG